MTWILNRLKERSTWTALITILGLCGVKIAPELQTTIIEAVVAVVSIVFAVTADNKPVTIAKPTMDELVTGVRGLVEKKTPEPSLTDLNP